MTPERELAEKLYDCTLDNYHANKPYPTIIDYLEGHIAAFKESEIAKFKQSLVE